MKNIDWPYIHAMIQVGSSTSVLKLLAEYQESQNDILEQFHQKHNCSLLYKVVENLHAIKKSNPRDFSKREYDANKLVALELIRQGYPFGVDTSRVLKDDENLLYSLECYAPEDKKLREYLKYFDGLAQTKQLELVFNS